MFVLCLWLVLSLSTLGPLALFISVLFLVSPCDLFHQLMWWPYVVWGDQLHRVMQLYLPDIEYKSSPILEDTPFVLVSNHYSWLDILVLYATVFSKKTPFVFVMKKSLWYLPIIGQAAWAVGHPMIFRGAGKKNGQILKSSAEKARQYGYGIVLFPEGTRYTKTQDKDSQYQCLLNPKFMGFDYITKALGSEVYIADVTIAYEKKNPSMWSFLRKKTGRIKVKLSTHLVQHEASREWLKAAWVKKDQDLQLMQSQFQEAD